jgi:hypothetical protein
MKVLKLIPVLGVILLLASCSTVRVVSDYDQTVNFNEYRTYAFYKPGIDEAEISDLDKKRVLRAIDAEMSAKGFTKSNTNPAVLVSIFAKAQERVDVYQNNFGFGGFGGFGRFGGFGFSPFGFGGFGFGGFGFGGFGGFGNNIVTQTEGTLYIDIIDNSKNQLVWQGQGTAPLTNRSIEKREERIQEIVNEIMQVYPPQVASK